MRDPCWDYGPLFAGCDLHVSSKGKFWNPLKRICWSHFWNNFCQLKTHIKGTFCLTLSQVSPKNDQQHCNIFITFLTIILCSFTNAAPDTGHSFVKWLCICNKGWKKRLLTELKVCYDICRLLKKVSLPKHQSTTFIKCNFTFCLSG